MAERNGSRKISKPLVTADDAHPLDKAPGREPSNTPPTSDRRPVITSSHDDAQRPVFVLTVARSGSTLLRFILDSHPDLACPPETSIGQVCFLVGRLWDILEPAPESASRDYSPNEVPIDPPAAAAQSIRRTVDDVYHRYLVRQGKRRWCDKSLDNTKTAELLAHLYPDAQFICLYRHCMDVVVSAVDAAPWGLNGYGFDAYAITTPGNMPLAAARCWLDQTKAICQFQARYPDRCHGIRYEDLVSTPEEIVEDLFTFLGLTSIPGITDRCLVEQHDARGPADHKIWFTSRISTQSLGQGTRVPVQLFPPEFLDSLNETLDQLSYRQIDEAWRTASGPIDPRSDAASNGLADGRSGNSHAEFQAATAQLSERLHRIPARCGPELTRRWSAGVSSRLCVAVESPIPGAGAGRCWALSHQDSELVVCEEDQPPADATTLVASARTWLALLKGTANAAAELRKGRLRLLDRPAEVGNQKNVSATTHVLAHLLGLAGPADISRAQITTTKGR